MAVEVKTRRNRHGRWWASVTYNGYDQYFEDRDILGAQEQMHHWLVSNGCKESDIVFLHPTEYVYGLKGKLMNYLKKLDNNPQG